MKNNFIKLLATALFFCTTVVAIAQPGSQNETENLEVEDAPAPIDDYLLPIAIIGLAVVFTKFRANSKRGILQK